MTSTPTSSGAADEPDRGRAGAGLSRRALLGGGALLSGAALGGAVAGHAAAAAGVGLPPAAPAGAGERAGLFGESTEPFWGEHQAGVTTPHQAHGVFVGLNLRPGATAASVGNLLRLLTDDAARLTQGRPPLGALEGDLAALPARLTVTFGFGAGLFDAVGKAAACPPMVRTLPAFSTDALDPRWGPTDLLLQICSEDPMTLTYAQRRLVRDAVGHTTLSWVQRGFLTARGTEPGGTTPRNLMGMRDGTANETDPEQVAQVVWHADRSRLPWLVGGSQLVLRRIRIDMGRWDDIEGEGKEIAFGRRVGDGSPLTGTQETDVVDRSRVDNLGFPMVDPNAHAARAQARTAAERMIRRPYNYVGETSPAGVVEEGLLFAAYQADLAAAFVPVQARLAQADALNTWTTHIGSATYAIPPGAKPGSFIGQTLLES